MQSRAVLSTSSTPRKAWSLRKRLLVAVQVVVVGDVIVGGEQEPAGAAARVADAHAGPRLHDVDHRPG